MNFRVCLLYIASFVLLVACSPQLAQESGSDPPFPTASPTPEPDVTVPPSEDSDGDEDEPTNEPADYRVLFVGNSLTYVNDLPQLFEAVALEAGKRVEAEMLAFPNYGLEDHWAEGKVQKKIESGAFDYVVVQQGPSSQEYGRESLIAYGGMMNGLCEDHGAKMAYFMVWPARYNYETFEGVIDNYRYAATLNRTLLCPVGEYWKEHFEGTGDFSYYGQDDFHPSEEGSRVAAEIIYYSLLSPKSLTGN